jgi:hypothetical protein
MFAAHPGEIIVRELQIALCIVDLERQEVQNKENYLLLEVGWQHPRRIYNIVFHLRLQQGKIRIEQDWTREGVGYQLVAAGVPPELIELSYQPPETRPLAQRQMSQQMVALS